MKKATGLIVMAVALTAGHTFGKEFHVAKNGADSNPGSKKKPFLTI